jgi:hypothetical protein
MNNRFHPVEIAKQVFSIDVRALAALRISLGLLILMDLWLRSEFLTEHYTDSGVLPRAALELANSGFIPSLYMLDGSTWFAGLLFVTTGLFALMLIAGYRTRFAVVACLVLMISLHQRNGLVCNAGDRLLEILLFWSLFSPLGAVWAADRHSAASSEPPRSIFTPASVGLLVQVVAIYFFSALHKLHPAWTANHTAIYFALSSPYATDLGRQAGQWPFPFLQFLTASVFRLELYGWVPAFSPIATSFLRVAVLFAFISFHAGLATFMGLGIFPWISMASWLVFLPTSFWDRAEKAHLLRAFFRSVNHALSRLSRWGDALPSAARFARPSPAYSKPGLIIRWAPLLGMAYVLFVNVASIHPAIPLPGELQRWGAWIGIHQRWRMFAPAPRRIHGWYVATAQLADGASVDLIRPDNPIEIEPAPFTQRGQQSKLQRCYLIALNSESGHDHLPAYVRWLRGRWDDSHSPDRQVCSVDLRFEIEYVMPPGRPPLRTSATLYEWAHSGDERLAPLQASWKAVQTAMQSKYDRGP